MRAVAILLFSLGAAAGLVLGCVFSSCPDETCEGTLTIGTYEVTVSDDPAIDLNGGTIVVGVETVTLDYWRGSEFRVTFARGD